MKVAKGDLRTVIDEIDDDDLFSDTSGKKVYDHLVQTNNYLRSAEGPSMDGHDLRPGCQPAARRGQLQ